MNENTKLCMYIEVKSWKPLRTIQLQKKTTRKEKIRQWKAGYTEQKVHHFKTRSTSFSERMKTSIYRKSRSGSNAHFRYESETWQVRHFFCLPLPQPDGLGVVWWKLFFPKVNKIIFFTDDKVGHYLSEISIAICLLVCCYFSSCLPDPLLSHSSRTPFSPRLYFSTLRKSLMGFSVGFLGFRKTALL